MNTNLTPAILCKEGLCVLAKMLRGEISVVGPLPVGFNLPFERKKKREDGTEYSQIGIGVAIRPSDLVEVALDQFSDWYISPIVYWLVRLANSRKIICVELIIPNSRSMRGAQDVLNGLGMRAVIYKERNKDGRLGIASKLEEFYDVSIDEIMVAEVGLEFRLDICVEES